MRRGKAAQSEIKQLEAAEGDVAKGGTKGSTSKPSYFDSVKHIGEMIVENIYCWVLLYVVDVSYQYH